MPNDAGEGTMTDGLDAAQLPADAVAPPSPQPVPPQAVPHRYIPPQYVPAREVQSAAVGPTGLRPHDVRPHDVRPTGSSPQAAANAPADGPRIDPVRRPRSASPRIPSSEKRRNRRRKSKFAKPLLSLAHGLLVVQALLLGLFVAAVAQGVLQGSNLQVRSVDSQQLSDLNLPGVETRPRSSVGSLQFAIWIYLFGAPAIFAAQRGVLWSRTNTGAKYLTVTIMALWFMVIMVILVAPNVRV
jgi:hypothetical protein